MTPSRRDDCPTLQTLGTSPSVPYVSSDRVRPPDVRPPRRRTCASTRPHSGTGVPRVPSLCEYHFSYSRSFLQLPSVVLPQTPTLSSPPSSRSLEQPPDHGPVPTSPGVTSKRVVRGKTVEAQVPCDPYGSRPDSFRGGVVFRSMEKDTQDTRLLNERSPTTESRTRQELRPYRRRPGPFDYGGSPEATLASTTGWVEVEVGGAVTTPRPTRLSCSGP